MFEGRSSPSPPDTPREGDTSEHSRAGLSAERIDFELYHGELRRRWRVLLTGAVLGAAVGFSLAMSSPVLYEGATTLLASPGTPSAAADIAAVKPLFQDLRLAAEVIDDLDLAGDPHNLTPERFTSHRVSVLADPARNQLELRVRLEDAALAARASRLLAEKAIALSGQVHAKRRSVERQALKKQLDRATERLTSAEKALLEFQQQAQLELLKGQVDAFITEGTELVDLDVRMDGERARLRAAERELKQLARNLDESPRGDHQPGSKSSSALPQGAGTSGTRAAERPAMFGSDDRLQDGADSTRAALESAIAESRLELSRLERRREQLARARKDRNGVSAKLNLYYERRLELARLEADYEVAARLRQDLLMKYEQAGATLTTAGPQLSLVNTAVPAERPLSRRGLQSSGVGLGIGLLAAGLFVVVRANGQSS